MRRVRAPAGIKPLPAMDTFPDDVRALFARLLYDSLGIASKFGLGDLFRATSKGEASFVKFYGIFALLLAEPILERATYYEMYLSFKGLKLEGKAREYIVDKLNERVVGRWHDGEWLGLDVAVVDRRNGDLILAYEAEMPTISSLHFPPDPTENSIGRLLREYLKDFHKLLSLPCKFRVYLGRISSYGKTTDSYRTAVENTVTLAVQRALMKERLISKFDSLDIILLLTGGAPRYIHGTLLYSRGYPKSLVWSPALPLVQSDPALELSGVLEDDAPPLDELPPVVSDTLVNGPVESEATSKAMLEK